MESLCFKLRVLSVGLVFDCRTRLTVIGFISAAQKNYKNSRSMGESHDRVPFSWS